MMPRRLLLLSLVALLGLAACQPTGKGDAPATTKGDGAADAASATPIPQIVSKFAIAIDLAAVGPSLPDQLRLAYIVPRPQT